MRSKAGTGSSERHGGDARCGCGSLLARLTPRGVEIKCRRCGRITAIALESAGAAGARAIAFGAEREEVGTAGDRLGRAGPREVK